jgi:hypothetical protein
MPRASKILNPHHHPALASKWASKNTVKKIVILFSL